MYEINLNANGKTGYSEQTKICLLVFLDEEYESFRTSMYKSPIPSYQNVLNFMGIIKLFKLRQVVAMAINQGPGRGQGSHNYIFNFLKVFWHEKTNFTPSSK